MRAGEPDEDVFKLDRPTRYRDSAPSPDYSRLPRFANFSADIVDDFGRPFQYDNIRDPQTIVFNPYPLREIRDDPTLVAPDPRHPGNPTRNLQGVDIFSLGVGSGTQCTRPLGNFKCGWEP